MPLHGVAKAGKTVMVRLRRGSFVKAIDNKHLKDNQDLIQSTMHRMSNSNEYSPQVRDKMKKLHRLPSTKPWKRKLPQHVFYFSIILVAIYQSCRTIKRVWVVHRKHTHTLQ